MIPTEEIENELHRIVVEMYLKGEKISDISKKTKFQRVTIYNIVRRYGYEANRKTKFSLLSFEEMLEMHRNGKTYEEIGEIAKITPAHVKNRIDQMIRVEKTMSTVNEEEMMKKVAVAKDRRKYKVVCVNGKRYTDVTDFFAGV